MDQTRRVKKIKKEEGAISVTNQSHNLPEILLSPNKLKPKVNWKHNNLKHVLGIL